MNIMLATVTERTREIGIRRALGAKRRDITLQFLTETAVLSASGVDGVMLGSGSPPWLRVLGIPVVIRPWSPILAFGIAVSIGLVFGVFPARRAARMDPVEALRAGRTSVAVARDRAVIGRWRPPGGGPAARPGSR